MHTQLELEPMYADQQIWDEFLYFECEQMAGKFLFEIFEKRQMPHAKAVAFRAAPKLSYAVKQAHEYYRAAQNADLLIKPLLCFYGMTCLVRALLVKHLPEYPTKSSVLKHGLTTRKLKREGYRISDDIAMIQRDGLYVVFHQLLHASQVPTSNKCRMGDLMSSLPELRKSIVQIGETPCIGELNITSNGKDNIWMISRTLLRNSGRTPDEFLRFLNENLDEPVFSYHTVPDSAGQLTVIQKGSQHLHKALSRDTAGRWFIRLPYLNQFLFHEMCTHYIVMFVLGMLCRYETERWGEIILGGYSGDAYIIQKFLNLSYHKFPMMILGSLVKDSWLG